MGNISKGVANTLYPAKKTNFTSSFFQFRTSCKFFKIFYSKTFPEDRVLWYRTRVFVVCIQFIAIIYSSMWVPLIRLEKVRQYHRTPASSCSPLPLPSPLPLTRGLLFAKSVEETHNTGRI